MHCFKSLADVDAFAFPAPGPDGVQQGDRPRRRVAVYGRMAARREDGVVVQDLCFSRTGREQVQHERHPDTMSAHARFAETDIRIDRDPLQ